MLTLNERVKGQLINNQQSGIVKQTSNYSGEV